MNFVSNLVSGLRRRAARLHKDERGLEGLEYLLIAALVIIASVAAWKFLGKTISNNVNKIGNAVDSSTTKGLTDGGFNGQTGK